MNEVNRNRLVNALKKAGMSEGLVAIYEDLDDAALEKVITGLEKQNVQTPSMEDVIGSEAFTKFVQDGGFDKLLAKNKAAQSEFDRKMAKGFETRLANFLKDDGKGGNPDPGKLQIPSGADETTTVLLKAIEGLNDKIAGLEAAKSTDSKLEQAKKALASSKLPQNIQEKWLNRIDLNKADVLEDQVKAMETEYAEILGVPVDKLTPGKAQEQQQTGYQFDQSRNKQNPKERSASEKAALVKFAKGVKL